MAIVRVQGNKRAESSGNTISLTLDSTPISGNLLIAVIGTDSYLSFMRVTNISQTGVNWSTGGAGKQIFQTYNDHQYDLVNVEIWVGIVGSGASTRITVTLSGTPERTSAANVCEYSGLSTSGFLDKTASNASAGSGTIDSGTTDTTTQADELWIGGFVCYGSLLTTPTNGFTLMDGGQTSGAIGNAYTEKIVSSIGTAQSGVTKPYNGTSWAGVIATFKAGSGPPPVPEVPYDIDVTTILTPTLINDIDVALSQLDITRDNDIDTLLQKLDLTATNDIDSIINLVQILPNDIDLILERFDITRTNSIDTLLQVLGLTTTNTIDVLIQMLNLTDSKYIDFVIKGALIDKSIDVDFFRFGVTNSKTIDTIIDNFLLKGRMNAAKESLISKIQAYDSTLVVMDAWRLNKWDFDAQTQNLISIKIMPSRMNRLNYGSMITNNYFGQYYSYHFTLHVLTKYDTSQTIHAKTAMDIANGIVNYLRINQQDSNKGLLSIVDITARESDPYGMTRGGAFMARIIVEGVMFCERPYKHKSEVV